jgi:hypothetical protein
VPRSPDFKADPVQHKRLSRQPLQTIVARRSNRQTDQPGAATAARLSRIHQIRELRCPFREMRVTASNVSLHSRDVAGFRDFRGHRFLVQPLASTDENASAVLVLRVGVCKPKCLLQCSGYLDTRPATANTLNFRLHRLLQRGGHDNRVAIQFPLFAATAILFSYALWWRGSFKRHIPPRSTYYLSHLSEILQLDRIVRL